MLPATSWTFLSLVSSSSLYSSASVPGRYQWAPFRIIRSGRLFLWPLRQGRLLCMSWKFIYRNNASLWSTSDRSTTFVSIVERCLLRRRSITCIHNTCYHEFVSFLKGCLDLYKRGTTFCYFSFQIHVQSFPFIHFSISYAYSKFVMYVYVCLFRYMSYNAKQWNSE